MAERNTIPLGGKKKLTIADLVKIARNPLVRVEPVPETRERIEASAKKVADLVQLYRDAPKGKGPREYGVTTGFGEFKDKPIPFKELFDLQENLLLSHSVGVGENTNPEDLANYYSAEVVRATLLIRLNTFLKGHSGVRVVLVDVVRAMLNAGVIPLVPLRGSVGASGDLCPLSHLFATLLGEGSYYRVQTAADLRNARPKVWLARRQLTDNPDKVSDLLQVVNEELRQERRAAGLADLSWDDLRLHPKEGLALNNGANFSAAMLALGVYDAQVLADTADVAVSMTLEAMGGCLAAFDEKVHAARPHPGQVKSAQRVRTLLEGSRFVETAKAVQDPYSLRCAPQVHGASHDAIKYAASVAECEINSATDNPLFFDGARLDGLERKSYSAGNFHGQPIALAADFLTIAVAELANISERRTQMLLDGHHNRNLPENLIPRPGLNSGFMIAQYSAASLVSENKVLSHPASVDSIPTSANSEDHVSMSTHAARKMRTVLGNAQSVIAIELLAAAQAIEWRVTSGVPATTPLSPKDKKKWRPDKLTGLKKQADEFQKSVDGKEKTSEIAANLTIKLRPVYLSIRSAAEPMVTDRTLDGDIREVRRLIEQDALTGPRPRQP